MDNRPTSEYAQSDQTSAAASAHYTHTPQPEVRSTPHRITASIPPPARSPAYQDYLPRPQSYAPNSQPGGAPGMAQATNPSLPANSPTYPPAYSPYQPQGHEMAQYQSHPPPPHQMYSRPDWPPHYGQGHHMPGPYASPATTVGSASPVATSGPRPGQVYSFVPIPGAQQHKRPRRRYEEIERMYKCGWNGCEKAYGTLNHLNAHVTMQSHGAKRTPEEFKEIRKEWKARKKEEEAQRKAAEDRERVAAQAQASQVDASGPPDPSQGQPSAYGGGVRPQLPPIGYQPADSQVPSQYGAPGGGMVYQSNGQMGYPPNYPHSPYQSGPVYQQRE
ncbi:hypothetical protein N7450_000717 [Penicillium hetheringtonii]|uniref:C2H2-type domain-containing protein n=1 Tax=Penicillium hetheringtonii TaxID=911720 RepID=A0AAD6E3Y6_9EURO|nr:hypothetical protein N7450_000717 [Penicillium hetheringtonii]